MTFLVLSFVAGLALTIGPLYAARKLRARWKLPRGLFIKSGLALLIIEIVHMAAIGNASSLWPQIMDWPEYFQAVVFGLASGLFLELGRFLVLDKMMKNVRQYREGLYFGLGWSGVETILLGIIIMIAVFGMQMIGTGTDVADRMPGATKEQVQQLQDFQKQAADLMNGNPLVGLAPILERGCLLVIDIAMTILILAGFARGTTAYTWAAVGFRSLFTGSLLYVSSLNMLAGESLFIVFALAAYFIIRQSKSALEKI